MKLKIIAKFGYIVFSAIFIALGLSMVIWHSFTALSVCYLISAAAILCGIIKLLGYFAKDSYELAFQFDFALGIYASVIGMILLIMPKDDIADMHLIMGMFILVDGLFKIQTAIDAKKFGLHKWQLILAASILTSLLGIILYINPFNGFISLLIFMGIALLADGFQNLFISVYTIKTASAKNF